MIRIDLKRICSVAVIAMLATPALGEPVTIAVWMHEHPPRLALDEKLVAAFEQANPDINRAGSVCLNSFGRFAKWISASIMLPPSSVSAR
ncbi:hypothetical protein GOE06_25945 [Sinorhizobium medicae]|nr:hypothetical protein [Sinorhizobium medicae]